MDKIIFLNSVLSDIGNFALVIFGFSITLFTVLYSFVLNKKEQLKEYSDRIKVGEQEPLLFQQSSNAKSQIKRLKSLNFHLIIVIFSNLLLYFVSLFSKYYNMSEDAKVLFTKGIGISTVVIIVYVVIMLVLTVKDYIKNTKI